jgi:polysaccharide deacetylase family sporulation protein PdaB
MRKQAIGICIFLLCGAGLLAFFYEPTQPALEVSAPVSDTVKTEGSSVLSTGTISIALPKPVPVASTTTPTATTVPTPANRSDGNGGTTMAMATATTPTNIPPTAIRSATVPDKPVAPDVKETATPTNAVAGVSRPEGIPAKIVEDLPTTPETKPESVTPLPIFSSGPSDSKRIAITFDDGPHPVYTYKILDELRAKNIKATFFVIGSSAKRYPWILQQIVAEGHEIGNHTYSHTLLSRVSSEKMDEELNRCQEAIREAIGYETTLFRPPYGVYRSHAKAITQQHHMDIILWSVDPMDWRYHDEERVYQTVTSHVQNGSIILCHDGRPSTVRALPRIFETLQEKGYEFTTISNLCKLSPEEAKPASALSSK